jgi:hypothetical protein
MRIRKRVAARAAVVFGAVGLSVLAATGGAQAYTYDGQDPSSTGCSSGASTVASAAMYSGGYRVATIELRYSLSCHTGWARLTLEQTQGPCGNATAGYACPSGWITRNNDGRSYSCHIYQNQHQCYTPMVYDKGLTSFAEGFLDTVNGAVDVRTISY